MDSDQLLYYLQTTHPLRWAQTGGFSTSSLGLNQLPDIFNQQPLSTRCTLMCHLQAKNVLQQGLRLLELSLPSEEPDMSLQGFIAYRLRLDLNRPSV